MRAGGGGGRSGSESSILRVVASYLLVRLNLQYPQVNGNSAETPPVSGTKQQFILSCISDRTTYGFAVGIEGLVDVPVFIQRYATSPSGPVWIRQC